MGLVSRSLLKVLLLLFSLVYIRTRLHQDSNVVRTIITHRKMTTFFSSSTIIIITNLWCILLNCTREVVSKPTTNFSFHKTFKTPQEKYEDNIAKLDKLEILERSSFPTDDSKEVTTAKQTSSPGAVASALVNLRFPEMERRYESPPPHPSYYWHNCNCPVPYYPPCCVTPCHSDQKPDDTKPCTVNIINIFTMPKGVVATEDGGNTIPHIYFYTPNKDGTSPTLKDVLDQNVTKLTDDDYAAIDTILDAGVLNLSHSKYKAAVGHAGHRQQTPSNVLPMLTYMMEIDHKSKPLLTAENSVRKLTTRTRGDPCSAVRYIKYDDSFDLIHKDEYGTKSVQDHQTRGRSILIPCYSWKAARIENNFSKESKKTLKQKG